MSAILHVFLDDELQYAENWPEMSALIDQVMTMLKPEGMRKTASGYEYYTAGDHADLQFSTRRHAGGDDWPNNLLRVAINTSTGYGALTWYAHESFPIKGIRPGSVWVSDNPSPPDFDPRIIADGHTGDWHDPRNALPLGDIRRALEEYCRTGTGTRPESVAWLEGDFAGRRVNQVS